MGTPGFIFLNWHKKEGESQSITQFNYHESVPWQQMARPGISPTWISDGICDGDLGETQVATQQNTIQRIPVGGRRNHIFPHRG